MPNELVRICNLTIWTFIPQLGSIDQTFTILSISKISLEDNETPCHFNQYAVAKLNDLESENKR